METLDPAISRTCALWENHDGIAFLDFLLQIVPHLLRIRDGEEVGIADDDAIEWIMPHPVFGEDDEFWRQHHDAHQVEVRLVITDNHRWLFESLSMRITIRESRTRYMINDEARLAL